MMVGRAFPCLLLALVACAWAEEPEVVSVVLLGATGDLARKYLWQAIFTLFVNHRSSTTFKIVAGARDTPEKGAPKVQGFLDTRLSCDALDIAVDLSGPGACASAKSDFGAAWTYRQLKKDADYQALDATI